MNMNKNMKEIIGGSLAVSMVMFSGFTVLEPQFVSAVTTTQDQVVVSQTVTSDISITSPADTSMSRALTTTEDTAVGTTTWNVKTNSRTGYTMTIAASSTAGCQDHDGLGVPDALCDKNTGEAFNDIATTSKATWSVSNGYFFGWSALGNHTTGFGTGSFCNAAAHVPSTTLLYQGFDGTRTYQFASSTSETNQAGTDTNVCFAVEQETVYAPSGSFQATTTATATIQ